MAFNIGLSGIRAASTDLEVRGNNVANASTTGFKESRTEFGDVYTTTLLGTGVKPVGSGVLVDNVRQKFSQGNISGTGKALDMAIDGNGFFIVSDRGAVSYTRAGAYALDKDGYVVANNGARLQGYDANSSGVVNGVLGDIQIEIANQPPRLTNLVAAIVNVNAGAEVLQEQGKTISTAGLAIGAADAGIPESTATILASKDQPTTGGTPSRIQFGTDLATIGNYTAANITIDIGDGSGPQTVSLTGIAAGATPQAILNDVQRALDATFGTQELRATQVTPGGELAIERTGYAGTTGAGFTVTNKAAWDARFGASGVVTAGAPGSALFIGSTPTIADFRSVPGTSTTTRTTSTPPLNIVTSNPGSFAQLTANNNYAALDLSAPNNLTFSVATEGGASRTVRLGQATWSGAAPAGGFATVPIADVVAQINTQINAAAGGVANARVQAVDNAGRIEFQVKAPAAPGDFVRIADNAALSSGLNLGNLGFLSSNFFNSGTAPVQANNEFQLAVTSSTGNAAGPFTIVIPPANYATLDDLAAAIQNQVDTYIGGTGLADKVSVSAVGGQIVFTNSKIGGGEGIAITATAAEPQAVNALGFNSMFTVAGQDTVDRANSFRINLTVPAPDNDKRSGSVLIQLDEEYRSVQQLAASINRQLNSQNSDDYIGVRAEAVEIEPKVTPPQFKLRFLAVQDGEASIIKISDITASGADITEGQMFGLLQADLNDTSLLTTGIEGVTNEYPEQKVTLQDPDGNKTEIVIPENSEANAIVSIFNKQPGVTASAETVVTLPQNGFNSPAGNMKIKVNGQLLDSTSLTDMAKEIGTFRGTTLPGFKAEINPAGDMVITNEIGRDVKIEIVSPVATDSLVVQGKDNTGPVVLGGSATGPKAAAVGGEVNFTLNQGYLLQDPDPAVSGIFGALADSEFTSVTLNQFDPKDQGTYNHATSTTIYDSLGNSHVMTQYFVKEPVDPNRADEKTVWAMYVLIDGNEVGDPDPTKPFPENLEATRYRQELFFNADGTLDVTATGKMYVTNWDPKDADGNATGAVTSQNVLEGGLPLNDPPTNSNFEIKLDGSTQFGSPFAVNQVSQNGYTTGRLTGLEIDKEGLIFARFTNGQAQTLGQVALANFRNPEGLIPQGDTGWAESAESGVATVGSPKTASFGQIKSSALEDSNVELSEQLVGLIVAQRNFQASAKTIETVDQVTQTILQI
ncbi:MAG: flagellar hook-basal body complex protein [Saccharospirillaceae bacterium]|nr:flagellar biosynthesis protein FlgE [Thalassolituus sp. HI0120]MCH2039457.1 flagellar hook-basal body complex protein [Saccharospirillaceae bacterium]